MLALARTLKNGSVNTIQIIPVLQGKPAIGPITYPFTREFSN